MLDIQAVIRWAKTAFPHALFVSTTGYITRDLLEVQDDPENFYLVGSMGMAAPIGLGIALAQPHRRVIVLDGDGSFAMNTGALLSIAAERVPLLHIVLDNGVHASTGGQRTVGAVNAAELARAAGYSMVWSAATERDLDAVELATDGATLVHAHCAPRSRPIGGRLQITPPQLVRRFRSALKEVSA